MDLFGPTRTTSLGGRKYYLVIVDDYSHFTWVIFLTRKHEAFHSFEKLAQKTQNEKGYSITTIRTDHDGDRIKALQIFAMRMVWNTISQ